MQAGRNHLVAIAGNARKEAVRGAVAPFNLYYGHSNETRTLLSKAITTIVIFIYLTDDSFYFYIFLCC